MKFLINLIVLLCVARATFAPCDFDDNKKYIFCDTTKSVDERVWDFINQLTTQEKISISGDVSAAIERLHIPEYKWWSEGLHGVAVSGSAKFEEPTPYSTQFPTVNHNAMSFNNTLFNMIGQVTSTEARAMNNADHGGLTFWAPNINILKDPRWGRAQEVPGEDPFLTATYALHFVKGMQEGEDSRYLKLSACCKHWAVYNMENSDGTDRFHFSANATKRDWADTYKPAFEACIKEAKASSIMCSYNAVWGTPACATIDFMYNSHHYRPTQQENTAEALKGGSDLNCGSYYQNYMQKALDEQLVTEDLLNKRIFNNIKTQFRLGMFDPIADQPYRKITPDSMVTEKHGEIALEATLQGITMLKNNGQLPLHLNIDSKIAIVGPMGNDIKNIMGTWRYHGVAPFAFSVFNGFKKYYNQTTFVEGCDVKCESDEHFVDAKDITENADATIVVLGTSVDIEDENNDRAVFYAGYTAQWTGEAFKQIIAGNYNPNGKMTVTTYTNNLIKSKMTDQRMRPSEDGYPGRTYRFFVGEVLFPFGYGLSYSSFSSIYNGNSLSISSPAIMRDIYQHNHMNCPSILEFEINIINKGPYDGANTILVYTSSPFAGKNGYPIKSLAYYTKVFIKNGETISVPIKLNAFDFANTEENGEWMTRLGEWNIIINDKELVIHVTIV
ncbi:hypothetical protein WA158_008280 [Blastocystis sp. Blastoise]